MKLDPQRKAKLEKAIAELQETHDLPAIYCAGLATLIRDWQYDVHVTGNEVKAILEEHGMGEIVLPGKEQEMNEQFTRGERVVDDEYGTGTVRYVPGDYWPGHVCVELDEPLSTCETVLAWCKTSEILKEG